MRSAIGAHKRRGNIREVRHRRPQEKGKIREVSHRRPQDISESFHHSTHSEVSQLIPKLTDIRTRRHRAAQDLVADVVEAEMGTTAEVAMCEGAMVQTLTPPTKTVRKLGAADRPVAKEVGWSRKSDGLGGWGNIREVSNWRPQEKRKHP